MRIGMTVGYEWESAAVRGDSMPDGLPVEEQLAFQAMALLYARFWLNQISREKGSAEKGKIVYQTELLKRKLQTKEQLVKRSAEFFLQVEKAANQYAEDRTPENAENLWLTVSGLLKHERRKNVHE